MKNVNKELLREIIKTPSPSGFEDNLQRLISKKFKGDKQMMDHQGTLSVIYNPESDFKVQLAAHADEISLIVTGYNNDGTLSVDRNGGVYPKHYYGQHIQVLTPNPMSGVVGVNDSLDKKEKLEASDLFIDCGFSSLLEAKEKVKLGTYIVHSSDTFDMENNLFSGRAFDDRLGVYIINEASKRAKEMGSKNGIYASSTTGEETTGRGAYSSASKIKPDLSIIVDVSYASDHKGSEAHGDISLGKGGIICLGSIPNRKLNSLLEECAKECGRPLQYEVWAARTGTDGDTLIRTNEGVPQVLFSIPLRYMHSPIEVASYEDIESMIEILSLFLCKISKDICLNPFQL